MKMYLYTTVFLLAMCNCTSDSGTVSLMSYKDQPVVYTDFAMGSGGIAFYLFNCKGNPVNLEADDEVGNIPNLAKENIIYNGLGE